MSQTNLCACSGKLIWNVKLSCFFLSLVISFRAYLLLVQPLEDAKDIPAPEMTDSDLKSQLESLVKPPFYLAYEFSQVQ